MRATGEEHHGDMPLVFVAFGILGRGHGREIERVLNRRARGVDHVVRGVCGPTDEDEARAALDGHQGPASGQLHLLLAGIDQQRMAWTDLCRHVSQHIAVL